MTSTSQGDRNEREARDRNLVYRGMGGGGKGSRYLGRQDSTWRSGILFQGLQGRDFLLQSATRTNVPISEGYKKLSCFLRPGEWETLSLRGRSPRPGWMVGPDCRRKCQALASQVQGFPQKGRPRAPGRVTLTSRPRPRSTGCDPRVRIARSPSDAPGCSWRLLGFPQRLARLPSFAEAPRPISTAASSPCLRHDQWECSPWATAPGGRERAGRGQSPTSEGRMRPGVSEEGREGRSKRLG